MILVGIDIDKNRHTFSIIDKETGGDRFKFCVNEKN